VLQATYDSVNLAYVNMETQLDLCDIAKTAGALGVHLAVPDNECDRSQPKTTKLPTCIASLTLGPKENRAADDGRRLRRVRRRRRVLQPIAVLSITRMVNGKPQRDQGAAAVLPPGDLASGGGDRELRAEQGAHPGHRGRHHGTAAIPGRRPGKTGTTNGPYDSWFVGLTPHSARPRSGWPIRGGDATRASTAGSCSASRSAAVHDSRSSVRPLRADLEIRHGSPR
jgi:hypothetical protein